MDVGYNRVGWGASGKLTDGLGEEMPSATSKHWNRRRIVISQRSKRKNGMNLKCDFYLRKINF